MKRRFMLHWLDGKTEILEGVDTGGAAGSLQVALMCAGYGNGALRALDYWEEIKEEQNAPKECKVTFSMPIEVAKQIQANPQACIDFFKELGYTVNDINVKLPS